MATEEEQLQAAFKKYDADGSGDIDVAELRSALNDLGYPVEEKRATALMGKFLPRPLGKVDFVSSAKWT